MGSSINLAVTMRTARTSRWLAILASLAFLSTVGVEGQLLGYFGQQPHNLMEYPPLAIGQTLRENSAGLAHSPTTRQNKLLGIFPADPLVTVRGLPSVHEATTYTPSANPHTAGLRRRMYQNALRTTTKQGCNIGKVSVSLRDDSKDDLTRVFAREVQAKAVAADLQLKVLNHLAWFAGISDVQYCSHEQTSHYTGDLNTQSLPDWHSGCLFDDATVAVLTRPDNIPFQQVPGHFFSDIDFRHEYAVMATPGGDLGEFARGIGAVEQLLGIEIASDQVNELFHSFLEQMSQFGRSYFYMGSDVDADRAWYRTANVRPPLMPIDEHGRLRLIRASSLLTSIGSPTLQLMVRDRDGSQYGTRAAVTQACIEAFAACHLNPFDRNRAKLVFVSRNAVLQERLRLPCCGRLFSSLQCACRYVVLPSLPQQYQERLRRDHEISANMTKALQQARPPCDVTPWCMRRIIIDLFRSYSSTQKIKVEEEVARTEQEQAVLERLKHQFADEFDPIRRANIQEEINQRSKNIEFQKAMHVHVEANLKAQASAVQR